MAGESVPSPAAGGFPFLLRPRVNPVDICIFGACTVLGPFPGPAWLFSVGNTQEEQGRGGLGWLQQGGSVGKGPEVTVQEETGLGVLQRVGGAGACPQR